MKAVQKKVFWRFVKLRNQLLDVAWVGETALPFLLDRSKNAIWIVELATLELEHHPGVLSDQEPDHIPQRTVMSPVQVPFRLRELVVARSVVLESFKVQSSDRLAQIPVHFGIR